MSSCWVTSLISQWCISVKDSWIPISGVNREHTEGSSLPSFYCLWSWFPAGQQVGTGMLRGWKQGLSHEDWGKHLTFREISHNLNWVLFQISGKLGVFCWLFNLIFKKKEPCTQHCQVTPIFLPPTRQLARMDIESKVQHSFLQLTQKA